MRRNYSCASIDTSAATAGILVDEDDGVIGGGGGGGEASEVVEQRRATKKKTAMAMSPTAKKGGGGSIGGAASRSSATTTAKSDARRSEYVDYLTSYEGMVRRQDAEFDATTGHVGRVASRIRSLGSSSGGGGSIGASSLRDVVVGGAIVGDILATDSQLVMLMTMLVEAEERCRASSDAPPPRTTKRGSAVLLGRGLSLPEFVQAYELVVCAMQSLKSVGGVYGYDDASVGSKISRRLKERTTRMLRAFGPDRSTCDDTPPAAAAAAAKARDDTAKVRFSSCRVAPRSGDALLRGGLGRASSSSSSSGGGRRSVLFTNDEMTSVMRSKDVALSRIMEEHEAEMENLASGIEELRSAESRMRDAFARRRWRVRLYALLSLVIVVGSGVVMEARRRDYLERELTHGREAERAEDLRTISSLAERKAELVGRLGVVEGKIRYQTNRNAKAEADVRDVEARLDDVEIKWLMDREEIDMCFASGVESGEDLRRERSMKDGIEEELDWCTSRLRSREEAAASEEDGSERRVVVVDVDVDVDVDLGDGDGGGATAVARSKWAEAAWRRRGPVYLEMKYDRSVRDAMLSRQGYSALAGFGATVLLRGLVGPAFAKFFFFVVRPRRVSVVVPSVLPPAVAGPGVEMMVVDGIFGSSIAFLLIRAVATFLMP